MEEVLNGLEILVIDDSFIRGNVLRRVSELIKKTNVKKVYILSYTPPIGIIGEDGIPRGCNLGVDMPSEKNLNHKFLIRDKFGKKNKSFEKISEDYDSRIQVSFLSVKGMFNAYERLGMPRKNLESFCIGGDLLF